ncbi:MAG: type II toxin-antitoxin system Phd/YefM family antitoxin [Anaerolineales bacterium]|jgi:prevent-host-death family protein
MEEINVTQAARNLSELLNRVAYQGASFELTRGGKRIARLVPSGPPKELEVADLNNLFSRLPRLDEDDIDAFERDILESDTALAQEKDPWD